MDIKDLQNIDIKDLKNIDWASIKDRLFSQPNKILNIAIIGITAITVVIVYRSWTKTSNTLAVELEQQKEKAQALSKFEDAQKQFKKLLDNAPEPVSENRLIELLSEIAFESGVQIVTLSPTTKSSDNYTTLTSMEITISSENYSDVIRFMHQLEGSDNLIRVKGWQGTLKSENQQSSRRYGWGGTGSVSSSTGYGSGGQIVEVIIEIETLEFKNA